MRILPFGLVVLFRVWKADMDERGEIFSRANVWIKGNEFGATTNRNNSINVKGQEDVLVFSSVGYAT